MFTEANFLVHVKHIRRNSRLDFIHKLILNKKLTDIHGRIKEVQNIYSRVSGKSSSILHGWILLQAGKHRFYNESHNIFLKK